MFVLLYLLGAASNRDTVSLLKWPLRIVTCIIAFTFLLLISQRFYIVVFFPDFSCLNLQFSCQYVRLKPLPVRIKFLTYVILKFLDKRIDILLMSFLISFLLWLRVFLTSPALFIIIILTRAMRIVILTLILFFLFQILDLDDENSKKSKITDRNT